MAIDTFSALLFFNSLILVIYLITLCKPKLKCPVRNVGSSIRLTLSSAEKVEEKGRKKSKESGSKEGKDGKEGKEEKDEKTEKVIKKNKKAKTGSKSNANTPEGSGNSAKSMRVKKEKKAPQEQKVSGVIVDEQVTPPSTVELQKTQLSAEQSGKPEKTAIPIETKSNLNTALPVEKSNNNNIVVSYNL